MGTNYYCSTGRKLEVECDCGFTHIVDEVLHIGKNSYGWKFTLHEIDEKGLVDYTTWLEVLKKSPRIWDEYNETVSLDEMKKTILKKGKRKLTKTEKERMEELAKTSGYVLDRSCWLFGGEREGKDGNYTMMTGEFS